MRRCFGLSDVLSGVERPSGEAAVKIELSYEIGMLRVFHGGPVVVCCFVFGGFGFVG